MPGPVWGDLMGHLTTLGRYSTLGVYVTFRLESTEEFLWRAPQHMVPRLHDQVGHLDGADEVAQWYKVELVKWEYDREPDVQFGDPPQLFSSDKSYYGVCCLD